MTLPFKELHELLDDGRLPAALRGADSKLSTRRRKAFRA
jgi:hypothetical protein